MRGLVAYKPVVYKKTKGNDFLPDHLQSEINSLREENEHENSIIKVLLENEKLLIHGPSSNPAKTIRKCNFENLLNLNLSLLRNMQRKLL